VGVQHLEENVKAQLLKQIAEITKCVDECTEEDKGLVPRLLPLLGSLSATLDPIAE